MHPRPGSALLLSQDVPIELPVPPRVNGIHLQTALEYHQLDAALTDGITSLQDLRLHLARRGPELYAAARRVHVAHVGQTNAFVQVAEETPAAGLVMLCVERSAGQAIPPVSVQTPLFIPVHALLYAVYAARLPHLPRTTLPHFDGNGAGGADLLSVASVTLPSPESFAALNAWLYLRDRSNLAEHIVPPPPRSSASAAGDTEQLMESLAVCSGVWSNAAALGILPEDEELSECLQDLWRLSREQLVSLSRVEEQLVNGVGDDHHAAGNNVDR
jgi:hypothetical protein